MSHRVVTAAFATALLCACGQNAAPPRAASPAKASTGAVAHASVGKSAGSTPAPVPAQPAVTATPSPDAVAAPGDRKHPRLRVALLDGSTYDLVQHRGRWVVVNFWATWCGPCLKEMPQLSKLAARRDVDVIGLAYEDIEPQAMKAFLATHAPGYPIAILDTANPPADFDTPPGLPMTVLVAPDGSVAKPIIGPVTIDMIEQAIASAESAG